jgi:hypothetical protein
LHATKRSLENGDSGSNRVDLREKEVCQRRWEWEQRVPELDTLEITDGFRRVRVHDLKHTCGRRLGAAGVGFEDRQETLLRLVA